MGRTRCLIPHPRKHNSAISPRRSSHVQHCVRRQDRHIPAHCDSPPRIRSAEPDTTTIRATGPHLSIQTDVSGLICKKRSRTEIVPAAQITQIWARN